jgi:hypothetical protein
MQPNADYTSTPTDLLRANKMIINRVGKMRDSGSLNEMLSSLLDHVKLSKQFQENAQEIMNMYVLEIFKNINSIVDN